MQIGTLLLSAWPTVLYVLLYLIGLIFALEGQRLNIAGMSYFVYGFALRILSGIASLAVTYYIVVLHAMYGPMIMLVSLISFGLGILGLLLIVVGVHAIVSAYKEYLSTTHQVS